MCVPEGLLYKSKTQGNDMFIIKPSQPASKSSWVSGKKKWNEICDFWVHGCTRDQEQNGNPSASRQSFENENGRDRLYQEKFF